MPLDILSLHDIGKLIKLLKQYMTGTNVVFWYLNPLLFRFSYLAEVARWLMLMHGFPGRQGPMLTCTDSAVVRDTIEGKELQKCKMLIYCIMHELCNTLKRLG
jgi:hypothetical protein